MFNIQKPSTTCAQIQVMGHWNALTLLLWEMTWSLNGIYFHMLGSIESIIQKTTNCRHTPQNCYAPYLDPDQKS